MSKRSSNLFVRARECLCCNEVDDKLAQAAQLRSDWESGRLDTAQTELPDVVEAGHPPRPELVHPRSLPKRSFATEEGRLAMIHAVAHIEFNAINLACDAVFRFRDMPQAYYDDWVRVTAEEAEHFGLLRQRLRAGGRDYGDFAAHNGLWDMAIRTAGDPLLRMGLVPRMLEARGLDVTPAMIERFSAVGDQAMVDALSLVLREEIGHVESGSRWFRHICSERGVEPEQTYFDLLDEFVDGKILCPLHLEARLKAGFSQSELARLQRMCRR
ncbi:MAG: ferritin-like domain-containing protein [Gammaproteobacteria bacterium]|nr:ferritin-like domain-containing protein [Gammaproteobacteria bacterium]